MSTAATATVDSTTEIQADDQYAAISREYAVEKRTDGSVVVKDVPIFGENERNSFMGDVKYDSEWLRGAAKVDSKLREGGYSAPMHFGHHTFTGTPIEAAGHYELTGVRKCNLHGKKMHVAFANLVFKNEAKFEKYRNEYPYRSVEISHERPDQINSLALLSAEAPYFQFPIGNLKFGTELGSEQPKAHYFAWQADGVESFAGFPPSKKKASQPPKFGEDEESSGVSDGADGMAEGAGDEQGNAKPPAQPAEQGTNQNDVIVNTLNQVMGLLTKLVENTMKRADANANSNAPQTPEDKEDHQEPDGDEAGESDGDDMADTDKKNEKKPIVAASADVAAMEGKIAALEATIAQMRKEREDDALFSSLKADLKDSGIPDLDKVLREHIAKGTAQAFAAGVKQIMPPSQRKAETPSERMEDPTVADFLKKNPKADPVQVRYLAETYAAAPEGHIVRKFPLDKYIQVNLEMGA